MVAYQDLKKAKELGKRLRIAREEQGHNLAILAAECGLSVVQLALFEAGNFSALMNGDSSKIIRYAKTLQVDIGENFFSQQVTHVTKEDWDPAIPAFLRKKY